MALNLATALSALDATAADLPQFRVVVADLPVGQPWIIHPDNPVIYLHVDVSAEIWSSALVDAVDALRERENLSPRRPRLRLVPPLEGDVREETQGIALYGRG